MLRCYLGWAYRGLVDFLPGSYTVKNCWVLRVSRKSSGSADPDATTQLRPCQQFSMMMNEEEEEENEEEEKKERREGK